MDIHVIIFDTYEILYTTNPSHYAYDACDMAQMESQEQQQQQQTKCWTEKSLDTFE